MMKKMKKLAAAATPAVALAFVLWTTPMQAATAEDAAALYRAKCAVCHGTDGTANTPAGKKVGTRDFHAAEVKAQSDEVLLTITLKGKNKMPGYEKSLGADNCKALVAYIRANFMK